MTALGFTGTQAGLTALQAARLHALLGKWPGASFHHGDCVGADAEAHALALRSHPVVVHPPDNPSKRAWCEGWTHRRQERPYMERNDAIVAECDVLLACPSGPERTQPRSGTWATVRRAEAAGRLVLICWPDGTVAAR